MKRPWSTWGKRAFVVVLLQFGVLWPVLHSAGAASMPSVESRSSKDFYLPLGEYEAAVPIGTVDYVKKLHVQPEVFVDGPHAAELRERLHDRMPKVRDELRPIIARQDYLNVTTLQARERMGLEILNALRRILDNDKEVREVVFDAYELR